MPLLPCRYCPHQGTLTRPIHSATETQCRYWTPQGYLTSGYRAPLPAGLGHFCGNWKPRRPAAPEFNSAERVFEELRQTVDNMTSRPYNQPDA
jgi:hypothetical protein